MTVEDSAYVAVLENKLAQAERNLSEFRKIFTHWTGKTAPKSCAIPEEYISAPDECSD